MLNGNYTYTYDAGEREEAKGIREKYVEREETKLEKMKRLDSYINSAGVIEGLIVGIIGVLIFGVGMCMGLGAIEGGLVLGVIIGLVGAVVMAPAYFVYRSAKKRAQEKYVPEILALADEISEEK